MLVSVIFTILLPNGFQGHSAYATGCFCRLPLQVSCRTYSDSCPICSENSPLFTRSAILTVNIYSQLITGGCDWRASFNTAHLMPAWFIAGIWWVWCKMSVAVATAFHHYTEWSHHISSISSRTGRPVAGPGLMYRVLILAIVHVGLLFQFQSLQIMCFD